MYGVSTTKRKLVFLATALLILLAGAWAPKKSSDLVVHEWGTFLAMNGSDGVTLDGMYHEEHALPGFVHARSKDQLRIPAVDLKGETPVIYFYSDRPQDVRVRVRFPQGLWTQWYPQADYNGPLTAQAGSPPQLRNGHIQWNVRISPPVAGNSPAQLPKTETDSLWNYAREVDAAYVRPQQADRMGVHGEVERFLFYRGLGEARLPLQMSSSGEGLLSYDRKETRPLRHLFVIRVENGRALYRYIPALNPGESVSHAIPAMSGALPMGEFTSKIAEDLAGRLTEMGLYPKEARAMVNTWKRSYFETNGIRVLFVLPQEWTDSFIPLDIDPKPTQIVRVMVGRLEVLTPERERGAAQAVRDLSAADGTTREHAYDYLRQQGRYLEPILRRTVQTTTDETVRQTCKRLLLTDFVTELRAALNADNGSARDESMLDARSQLASLLREVGLNAQAAEEARRIVPEVQRMAEPPKNTASFRPYARIHARTKEGLGDDAAAAKWYARFVEFGSQSTTCGGCHSTQGPKNMAFYRDWWAGKKFAYYSTRADSVENVIARQLNDLKSAPDDVAARMKLAYLYELKGDKEHADRLWARFDGSAARQISKNTHSRDD